MAEFRWHLMAEEVPEEGECDYLVMGHKGGLKLAKGYRNTPGLLVESEFYCTKGGHGRMTIWPDDVYAWAKIPSLESDDTCHIINDGNGWWECDKCGASIVWDDPDEPPVYNYCPNCGRKVVEP